MSDLRTGQTHPLIVDEVAVAGTGGRIGMTLWPDRSDDQSLDDWHSVEPWTAAGWNTVAAGV